jgi:hypothetical protein
MSRYFPNFRWADVGVLATMLAFLALLSRLHPVETVWGEAWMPIVCIAVYAVWGWRLR